MLYTHAEMRISDNGSGIAPEMGWGCLGIWRK
jgi:hypothetical protein